MCPSQIPEGDTRGWIIPIGGGEEKENNPQILQRFVDLCGGADADIVVMPTASRLADTGARYERIFTGLGAGRVTASTSIPGPSAARKPACPHRAGNRRLLHRRQPAAPVDHPGRHAVPPS